MPTSLKQILEQARALSAEDRAKLAETLLESLHPPIADVEKAWAEEIEQRLAAFDRGEISAYSVEDVFADARRLSR
jgi:putative addiction module component (TIGR02574 family)